VRCEAQGGCFEVVRRFGDVGLLENDSARKGAQKPAAAVRRSSGAGLMPAMKQTMSIDRGCSCALPENPLQDVGKAGVDEDIHLLSG
jgi:hypothetical protein